jgi:hypothetical protein
MHMHEISLVEEKLSRPVYYGPLQVVSISVIQCVTLATTAAYCPAAGACNLEGERRPHTPSTLSFDCVRNHVVKCLTAILLIP